MRLIRAGHARCADGLPDHGTAINADGMLGLPPGAVIEFDRKASSVTERCDGAWDLCLAFVVRFPTEITPTPEAR